MQYVWHVLFIAINAHPLVSPSQYCILYNIYLLQLYLQQSFKRWKMKKSGISKGLRNFQGVGVKNAPRKWNFRGGRGSLEESLRLLRIISGTTQFRFWDDCRYLQYNNFFFFFHFFSILPSSCLQIRDYGRLMKAFSPMCHRLRHCLAAHPWRVWRTLTPNRKSHSVQDWAVVMSRCSKQSFEGGNGDWNTSHSKMVPAQKRTGKLHATGNRVGSCLVIRLLFLAFYWLHSISE